MKTWIRIDTCLTNWLHHPQNGLLLLLRVFLAWTFFKSGLLKIQSWETTLELFKYEYAVPLLSPELAAVLATAGELILPPLLVLGLLTRPTVVALFVLNVIAAISYPDLSPAGVKDHQVWGLGFACLFFVGAGALSIDDWARKHYRSTFSL